MDNSWLKSNRRHVTPMLGDERSSQDVERGGEQVCADLLNKADS